MYVLFMEEDTQLKDIFPDLEHYLSAAGAAMQASESHGTLCARYCVQERPDFEVWAGDVLGPVDASDPSLSECRQKLAMVYEITDGIFNRGMDEPVLLVPHDSTTLQQRSLALADWCSGFIAELGMGGLQLDESTEAEIGEILKDLIEVTHIDEQVDDSEENEQAYMEILEYVRVAVMSLALTLRNSGSSKTLH